MNIEATCYQCEYHFNLLDALRAQGLWRRVFGKTNTRIGCPSCGGFMILDTRDFYEIVECPDDDLPLFINTPNNLARSILGYRLSHPKPRLKHVNVKIELKF